jgi:hypothetical protein
VAPTTGLEPVPVRINSALPYRIGRRGNGDADGSRTRKVSRVKAGRLYQFAHRAMCVPREGVEPPASVASGPRSPVELTGLGSGCGSRTHLARLMRPLSATGAPTRKYAAGDSNPEHTG